MGLFKGLFSGLRQLADDDLNGLTNLVIACLVDDENCNNYRQWFVEQITDQGAKDPVAVHYSVYTNLVQQVADRERRGMGIALDEALWKLRHDSSF